MWSLILIIGNSTCRQLLKFTIKWNRYCQEVFLTCADIKDPRPHSFVVNVEHWFTYTTPLNLTRFKWITKAFSGKCVLMPIHFQYFGRVCWFQLLKGRFCGLVYKFFWINNIELKCLFVRCRKYHKSRWKGAAELRISVEIQRPLSYYHPRRPRGR